MLKGTSALSGLSMLYENERHILQAVDSLDSDSNGNTHSALYVPYSDTLDNE